MILYCGYSEEGKGFLTRFDQHAGLPDEQEPNYGGEARLALIEQGRETPLPPEQRTALLDALKGTEGASVRFRADLVPDGTEPAFVFQPARWPSNEADAPRDEAVGG